jgi:hypothetical protein
VADKLIGQADGLFKQHDRAFIVKELKRRFINVKQNVKRKDQPEQILKAKRTSRKHRVCSYIAQAHPA